MTYHTISEPVGLRIELREGREFRVAPLTRQGAERLAAHLIEDAPPGFIKYVHIDRQQPDDLDPARGLLRGTLIGAAIWGVIGLGLALLLTGCALDAAIVSATGGTYVHGMAYQSASRYVDPHDGTGLRSRAEAFQACGERDNSSWDVLDACMTAKGYPVKGGTR